MSLDPARAPLALGYNAVFPEELVGSLLEGLLGLEQTCARLAAEFQIPVLGKGLSEGQVLFLRRGAALLAADRGGTPPRSSRAATIELDLAAEDAVVGLKGHDRACAPAVMSRGPLMC